MNATLIKRIWPVAALTAVVVVAASNVLHVARKVPTPPTSRAPHVMIDHVTRTERRFAALREYAQTHGISGKIGYVEDAPADGSVRDADIDYFLAQFTLLPLVLDTTRSHSSWAVANFRGTSAPSIPPGWRVAHDFGEGVLLLGKSSR